MTLTPPYIAVIMDKYYKNYHYYYSFLEKIKKIICLRIRIW